MARHGKDEYGRPTDVVYTRGTMPVGKPKRAPSKKDSRSGSAPAAVLDGRRLTSSAYIAPVDENFKRRERSRWRSSPGRNKFQHDAAKEAESRPRSMVAEKEEKERVNSVDGIERPQEAVPFNLTFRPCEPDDYNFILNAWMKSYRDSMRTMKNEPYYLGQQNLIAELAKRRQLVMAIDAETPAWVAGFICGVQLEDGNMVVDYIYVKHAYREHGIARGLLGSLGWKHGQEIWASHKTRAIEQIMMRYNASYHPYFNNIGFSDV